MITLASVLVLAAGVFFFYRMRERTAITNFCASMDAQIAAFEEARYVAGATARIALAPMVTKMQEIKRETAAVQAPEQATQVRTEILKAMDEDVERFVSFMGEDTISSMSLSGQAEADWAKAKAYLADLRETGKWFGKHAKELEDQEAQERQAAEKAVEQREALDEQNAGVVQVISFYVSRNDDGATFFGELHNSGDSLASEPALVLRCAEGEREFRTRDIQPGGTLDYRQVVVAPAGKGPCWLKVKDSAHLMGEEVQ